MHLPGKLIRWDVLRLSNRFSARQRDPPSGAHGLQCASTLGIEALPGNKYVG
jgi:hypothetical protein